MNSSQAANKSLVIKLNHVKKDFGELKVLHDVSLEVYKGEFVTILGSSGSGKSTIFNIIAGLIDYDEGEVTVNGSVGYMQQKDLLLPWKNVADNVSLPLMLKKTDKKLIAEKLEAYLPLVGLKGYEESFPFQLSGGMRQRASFLRTLMTSEEIFLLDEAFGSLDSITRRQMQKWLLDMKMKLNNTILLITHDIDEAILLSDRIYVISKIPAVIKREISVDFNRDNKLERFLSPESLKLKEEILEIL
ncbi:MAG: ABC transporter ATP-binding protein [Eubacteriaceae bacterium]|nr:ABC transporter ATP-binding protein [Eubacteriaceae bacterium]